VALPEYQDQIVNRHGGNSQTAESRTRSPKILAAT
jgi:hypothetical protein